MTGDYHLLRQHRYQTPLPSPPLSRNPKEEAIVATTYNAQPLEPPQHNHQRCHHHRPVYFILHHRWHHLPQTLTPHYYEPDHHRFTTTATSSHHHRITTSLADHLPYLVQILFLKSSSTLYYFLSLSPSLSLSLYSVHLYRPPILTVVQATIGTPETWLPPATTITTTTSWKTDV